MKQQANKILQKTDIDKLPSLPHVLLHLLDICHDESLSFTDLAEILQQDSALYARVFSVCFRHKCKAVTHQQTDSTHSIEETLQQLGINTIKSIVVTAAAQIFFSRSSFERTDFLKQHWQHSLYCAHVSQSLAKLCNYSNPEEAYTAGLLHDIGQLVLETTYPEKYTNAFAQLSEEEIFHTLEQDEFETTHQQIGAQLLKKHGANNFVYDAVLYHHENIEHIQDAHPLVKIINVANMLTNSRFKVEDQQIFNAAKTLLDLDKPLLLEVLEKSKALLKNTAQSLEINFTTDDINAETAKQQRAGDEFKQIQLAEQVKNIALLDGAHQHFSRSGELGTQENKLLPIISQYVGILFGINHCILFLYDAKNNQISAISSDKQPTQLADISIPLKADRSLVSDALLHKQINHSFDDYSLDDARNKLSIIDRQLIGITHQTGIICLPLTMNNTAIGTLVLGADKAQYKMLWKQRSLLMRFANEIAHTISVSTAISHSSMSDKEQTDLLEQKIREVLHEVRNPLSIMNNYLGVLAYKLENDKPAQENVQTIKAEIERISLILNRLTEQESTTNIALPTDINGIISDLTNVFQTSLFADKNIQISLDLDKRITTLQSNANALKQIYTNLIKNSVEALPANGKLMVYTQDYVNVDGKPHIELSVVDNGPGIDKNVMSQLFSPVETTKGEDHAGLGLTIVKNLVNELHGSISCKSSDMGTSFHIMLPK
ncbi:hypothetical protein MNBD_GAMMA06-739 [hydrothermal vent metagenome]|uniref:Histidine kinase n=1 Tax=hydrothermal vent metagenome TaxID=652676 RepID=A0A3B0WSC8_9ZZZZ